MRRRNYILIGLGLLVLGAGGAGAYVLSKRTDVTITTPAGTVPLDTSTTPSPASELKVEDSSGTGQLSLGNQNGVASSDSQSKSTPADIKPADFKVFDQFKDAETSRYQEMSEGSGPAVETGKKVTVNYRGWLTTGQLFDDSYAKGKPIAFVVGQHGVIPGFEGGMVGMKVGGKRRIIIPPAQGYGEKGQDPVPGNAVLVFEVELVGVE